MIGLVLGGINEYQVVPFRLLCNDGIWSTGLYRIVSNGDNLNNSPLKKVTKNQMKLMNFLRVIISMRVKMHCVNNPHISKMGKGMNFNRDLIPCKFNDETCALGNVHLAFSIRNFLIRNYVFALCVIWRKSVFGILGKK